MFLWLMASVQGAGAWTVAELRTVDPVPAASVARIGEFDGAGALVLLGPAGLQVLDLAGQEIVASADLTGSDLVVRDLDDRGSDEVLICGPEGIRLVRADRDGIYGTVPLSTEPCASLAAYQVGAFAALISASADGVTRWTPAVPGLEPSPVGDLPPGPMRLVSLGTEVAALGRDGTLIRIGPEGVVEEELGRDVLDAAPTDAGLALALSGEPPELWIGEVLVTLPGPEVSLVEGRGPGAPAVWIVDRAASAVGAPGPDGTIWTAVPFVPTLALGWDRDGDGCTDLTLYGEDGAGAVLMGGCALAIAVEEPGPVGDWPARVPEPPSELTVYDLWATLDVQVGQTLDVRLVDGDGRALLWKGHGGPPGLVVQPDGRIEWTPDEDDVGEWRVSLRLSQGLVGRWNGLTLRVFPPAATGAPTLAPAEPAEQRAGGRMSVLAPRRCGVGLGLAGGAARAGEITWENLGGPDVRGGLSPMASMTCAGGPEGPVQWIVGADTAPFFSFASSPEDRVHGLVFSAGVQLGPERLHAGPYAAAGFDVLGLGARVEWLGLSDFRRHPMGVEGRLLWLAPQLGAEASLAWIWTL